MFRFQCKLRLGWNYSLFWDYDENLRTNVFSILGGSTYANPHFAGITSLFWIIMFRFQCKLRLGWNYSLFWDYYSRIMMKTSEPMCSPCYANGDFAGIAARFEKLPFDEKIYCSPPQREREDKYYHHMTALLLPMMTITMVLIIMKSTNMVLIIMKSTNMVLIIMKSTNMICTRSEACDASGERAGKLVPGPCRRHHCRSSSLFVSFSIFPPSS